MNLNFDYSLLIPEFILAGTAGVVLLADAFRVELRFNRAFLPFVAVLGALAALVVSLIYIDRDPEVFSAVIAVDDFTTFFRVVFIVTLIVIVIGSY